MPSRPARRGAPVLFLLAHDLRLGWREFRGHFRLLGNRGLLVLVALLVLAMHGAAWTTGTQLAEIGRADAAGRARVIADLAPGVTFILLLMLAQALSGLTKALYGRSDLDLILASPFSARTVFAVRVLAVGLGSAASAAIFVVPVADVALLQGAWRALALLPMLAGTALVTSAVGLAIVMSLLATLGARRTRLAAQIVATFAGGGFMVWLQVRRFLPALDPAAWTIPGPAALDDLWLLPTRAAAGEGTSLLLWLGLGAVLFAGAVFAFAGQFARGIAAASGLPAPSGRARRARGIDRPFRSGLWSTLRHKEWRLIRRDPWLLSQLLLQVLYMTPMLFMLMNGTGAGKSLPVALAPMIVVVAYQVSASMTWLSLSAEDAPDLLASAPVTSSALQRGKLIAVAELCAGLAGGPLLWLATLSLRAAAETALLAGLAVAIAMLLSLWHTKPAPRSGFAARHRESKLLALMEMVMSMLLGVTAALLVAGSRWMMLPLGVAALVMLVNRPRRRSTDRDAAPAVEAGQQAA